MSAQIRFAGANNQFFQKTQQPKKMKKRKSDRLLTKEIKENWGLFFCTIVFKRGGLHFEGKGTATSPDAAYGKAKRKGRRFIPGVLMCEVNS